MSILGVDIGTSTCKGIAFDLDARVLATASESCSRVSPAPGRCEIRPSDITSALDSVIARLASQTRDDPIEAMSFSVFGGSFVPLAANRAPLGNLVSTTDDRGYADSVSWSESFTAERTYSIVGMNPHPSLLLMKALACRRLQPDVFKQAALLASTGELVLSHLGIDPVVDRSTASTYMAYDLNQRDWSNDVLNHAGVDKGMLAPVVDCGSLVGRLSAAVADRLGLPHGVAVVAGGHDQQMAALGAGMIAPGVVTDSLGTVEAISYALDSPRLVEQFRLNNLPNLCHVYGGLFFTMVYNFSCADLLNWAARVFYGAEPGSELPALKLALAEMPETPCRVLVQPHFCGSGTPYMDPESRGAIVGLDLSTTRQELVRSIVDCQNYEMRTNIDIWRDLGMDIGCLRVFGGLAQNDRLLQIKADILGVEVARLQCREAGCLGAAALAGRGAGLMDNPSDFLHAGVLEERVFTPRNEFAQTHNDVYKQYRRVYGCLKAIATNINEDGSQVA